MKRVDFVVWADEDSFSPFKNNVSLFIDGKLFFEGEEFPPELISSLITQPAHEVHDWLALNGWPEDNIDFNDSDDIKFNCLEKVDV